MIRTHHSRKRVRTVRVVDQSAHDLKPRGLWYGVDGDWERWCREEEYGNLDNAIPHVVELGNERIMSIRNCEELDAFHTIWLASNYYPDWRPLAELYDGIEIAPYLWERRLQPNMMWYYAWDCASGCVWRPKSITVTAAFND